ncbi:MAG TPA: FAD-dependent oxidoreductase [Nocardioidaceae bacterium]|nr:FAD-dependent oxidoreductase [Nocardioidaceae bacterium]
MSRRGVLGGMTVGAGALAASSLTIPAEAATRQGSLPRSVDVVVVGGGLSGLVAARRVAGSGRSVLVLEARDRVGGRILNHTLRSGSVIESGGAFVGPTQDHLLALARDLGVRTFKEYFTGENVYVSGGRSTRYEGTVPPDPLILPDAAQLIERINRMSREVPVDAPWAAANALEWDSTTFHDWVAENSVNPAVQNLLLSYLQPTFGSDGRDMSLLFLLWYIAASGNERNPGSFERSSDTRGGAQDSRFVGGSGLIPQRLARRLGDMVALDAAVRRIEQRDDRVVVTSDRGVVRAQRVIVAAPPPTALAIDWFPLLPPKKMQLLQRMPMGQLMKADAVYEKPFWRKDGLTGMGVSDSGAVRVCFDNSPADAAVGVLLAFIGGSTWERYGVQPLAARRKAVLEGLARVVGPKALEPIEYVEHDWTHERWTMGGPVALLGAGTTTAFGPMIRKPFRRVHWAGTETSTYWSGYMDGAVRAGDRAGREVLERL